jgi:hypothetical protein
MKWCVEIEQRGSTLGLFRIGPNMTEHAELNQVTNLGSQLDAIEHATHDSSRSKSLVSSITWKNI